MGDDTYIYNEVFEGDRIVVDDLHEADYAYTEEVDERYEIREKGAMLGRFDDLEKVHDFLDDKDL